MCNFILEGVEDIHIPADYIHTLGATKWGFWGSTEVCENGSYAYGFEIRVSKMTGIFK